MQFGHYIFLFTSAFLIDVVVSDLPVVGSVYGCVSIVGLRCPNMFEPDKKYCCEDRSGLSYCCNDAEFFGTLGAGIIVTIVVIITGALIACCLCCLCCPCCILYKRRNPGTVYTPAVTTAVVVQTQQGAVQPMQPNVPYPVQPQAAAYPVTGYMPMPMPQASAAAVTRQETGYMQQPPPYSVATANDPYVKQAPYNPTY